MLHILDRFIIHFFASAGVMLCALFALRWVRRRFIKTWLPSEPTTQLLFCAIAIFAGSALREAYDVHAGQTLTKAIFDYISWAAGCGVSAWGLYRLSCTK